MKYNELKELTAKDWDGEPYLAIMTDNPENEVTQSEINILQGTLERYTHIVGYSHGLWIDSDDCTWKHAYRLEDNKMTPERMTNRQLAMWLARGNGQKKSGSTIYGFHTYPADEEDEVVQDIVAVRPFGTEEWIEPTIDMLGGVQ